MIGNITTPFRIATGSVRRVADLQREVAALRSAAKCAGRLKLASAHFPSAVLGEELLGMMSSQFRELLQNSNTKGEVWDGRVERRGFVGPAGRAAGGAPWGQPLPNEGCVAGGFEPSTRNASKVHGFETVASTNATQPPGQANEVPPAPGMETAWEMAAGNGAVQSLWPGVSPAIVTPKQPEPTGALVEKLREYWDLERRNRRARPSPGESGQPLDQRLPHSAPEARSMPESLRLVGQADFAKRLQAFVSGAGNSRVEEVRLGGPEAQQAAPNQYLSQPSVSPGPGMPLAGDFAERLAQTLREQAIQHGIDLT